MKLSKETVICEYHYPLAYPAVKKGKLRPKASPLHRFGLVFRNAVCPHLLHCAVAALQRNHHLSCEALNLAGTILFFVEKNMVFYSELKKRPILEQIFELCCPITMFENQSDLFIQSMPLRKGVPKFVLQVDHTLHFKTFHMEIKVSIPYIIVKNRIKNLNFWSAFEEIFSFLHSNEENHKMTVLYNRFKLCQVLYQVMKKIYCPEIMVCMCIFILCIIAIIA